jgi:hypothetical protein
VVASFREQICKNQMRQNVGKEKQKSTCFGILSNITYVQVMNFIPVKVSTLYMKFYQLGDIVGIFYLQLIVF